MRFAALGTTILSLSLSLIAPVDRAAADVVLPRVMGSIKLGSVLIPCSRADEHLVIDRDSHLDPRCSYTGGVEIVASGVFFDCRGATIEDPEGDDGVGVHVHQNFPRSIRQVSVRNCYIEGFRNNFRVTRRGFRSILPGEEYRNPFRRIEIRNSRLLDAREHGIVIDPYVTDVRLLDLEVARSGGAGIYLDSGSREAEILRNQIRDNGYADVDPVNGVPFRINGIEYRIVSTGREGLAIDGSQENHVSDNLFENNSNGAIMLFKNCGEFVNARPGEWFQRRFGANRNRIRRNTIANERHGVWVGARMSENQLLQDCSDEPYAENPLLKAYEDEAIDNAILNNHFIEVGTAIRVEDDGTRVERNRIESSNPAHVAIVVGTGLRSEILGKPVARSRVRSNRTNIFLAENPYTWIYEVESSQFERNRLNGTPVLFHQGFPPAGNFHLFVEQIWLP